MDSWADRLKVLVRRVTPSCELRALSHRLAHRFDDVGISAAPADVAAHLLADIVVGSGMAFVEQADRRADLARGAVAALERVVLHEGRLHRVKLLAAGDAFDRGDALPSRHYCESQTRVQPAIVDQHRAGAALPV